MVCEDAETAPGLAQGVSKVGGNVSVLDLVMFGLTIQAFMNALYMCPWSSLQKYFDVTIQQWLSTWPVCGDNVQHGIEPQFCVKCPTHYLTFTQADLPCHETLNIL